MHIALGAEPQTLDPHVASAQQEYFLISTLFEPLVNINPQDLAFVPGAAERWDYDTDGRGATFYLRRDGRWSNGDPVTAHDFVFAWRRAVNPRLGNQVAEIFFPLGNALSLYRAERDDFDSLGVRALDDYTLRLELAYPMPLEALLVSLSHTGAVPLHRGSLIANGAANARYSGWAKPGRLYGNGPFVLESWRFQRDLRIIRNRTYWDAGNVNLNGAVFYPVNSVNTQEKAVSQRPPAPDLGTALEQGRCVRRHRRLSPRKRADSALRIPRGEHAERVSRRCAGAPRPRAVD
jgi:oligopeptide transport system substrate-binding protein